MLNFILGVFVGGITSALTVALCVAARGRDADQGKDTKEDT
ncbi:MAG: DUF3789 domain-containing protein [Clostridiales bacterium]|nr:DUF3789 domain-containing protein [Clostridiales bacterium]